MQAVAYADSIIAGQIMVTTTLYVERRQIKTVRSRLPKQVIANIVDHEHVNVLAGLRCQTTQQWLDTAFIHDTVRREENIAQT